MSNHEVFDPPAEAATIKHADWITTGGGILLSVKWSKGTEMYTLKGTARAILDRFGVNDLAELVGRECVVQPHIGEMGFRRARFVEMR